MWFDMGTFDDIFNTAEFVRLIQKRQFANKYTNTNENISKFNETYLNKGIHKYINQLIRTKIVGNNGDLTKRAEKRLSKIYRTRK